MRTFTLALCACQLVALSTTQLQTASRVCAQTRPVTGGYAPRWSRSLRLPSLRALDATLNAQQAQGLPELRRLDKTAKPRSCSEWIRLHVAGYAAATPEHDVADRAALVRCGTLQLLKRAKPARISHVRKLVWDGELVKLLPAIIATVGNPNRGEHMLRADMVGGSLQQLFPEARGRSAGEGVYIDQRIQDLPQAIWVEALIVTPVAWADLDANGIEDVVVSVVQHERVDVKEDSGSSTASERTRLFTLTRTSPQGPLEPLDPKLHGLLK